MGRGIVEFNIRRILVFVVEFFDIYRVFCVFFFRIGVWFFFLVEGLG